MRNVLVGLILTMAAAVWGQATAHELVASANKALAKGAYDEALADYDQAATLLPDSPELAYNRGVAHYRKGELDKAAEQFTKALLTRDLALEAKAKFNLGNCAYADALQKQSDLKTALERLRVAIAHYKDAIQASPNDEDARANMEMAQLLMKDLLDKEKQRQEQEKQNPASQPESQPASRPESQPESQPQREPESQPASQPGAENQQEKQDQQQQNQQQQGQQQDGQKKDQQAKQEQSGKPDQQEQSKDQQGAQQAVPAEARQMSKEEAEKLLQAVRDKEQQRRAQEARLLRVRPVPVEKDW